MFPFPNLFIKFDNFILLLSVLLGVLVVSIITLFGVAGFAMRANIMALVEFAGMALLLKNGKFAYTSFARFVNIAIAIILVGAMFKVMHWPGADTLLIAGFLASPALYWVYFMVVKQEFTLLSILKLLLVPAIFIPQLFRIMHWPYVYELQIATDVLFAITLAVFIIPNFANLTKRESNS